MYYEVKRFGEVNNKELRAMRRISSIMTNEALRGYNAHDVVIVKRRKEPPNFKKEVVLGYCFISSFSPEQHFEDEDRAIYLYNYICDRKYSAEKPSVFLIDVIKNTYPTKNLNLDILQSNARACEFFKKNGFERVGEYVKRAQLKNGTEEVFYDSFTYRASLLAEATPLESSPEECACGDYSAQSTCNSAAANK